MTERLSVNDITSDQLDALYEQIEAAERTEAQRQLAAAREAFASATVRAAKAEAALDRVRQLAATWSQRGSSPALGTSIIRWWDARLIELNTALNGPKEN